jgi:hypothetical protein
MLPALQQGGYASLPASLQIKCRQFQLHVSVFGFFVLKEKDNRHCGEYGIFLRDVLQPQIWSKDSHKISVALEQVTAISKEIILLLLHLALQPWVSLGLLDIPPPQPGGPGCLS